MKLLKMPHRIFHVFGFSLFLLSQAQAAPLRSWKKPVTPEVDSRRESQDWRFQDQAGSPWRILIGADAGYVTYGSLNPANEGSKSGYALGGRALVAYYGYSMVAEAGVGGAFISVKGQNPSGSILCAGGCTDSILTKIPFLDASLRYRFGRYLQFGPEFQYNLGSDFALNTDVNSGRSNQGMFVGAQVVHEWERERKFRLGARWLTPISGTSRTVHQLQAFFQMAFDLPFTGSSGRPKRTLEQVSEEDLDRASYSTPKSSLPMSIPETEPPQTTEEALEPVPVPTPAEE
jgi:hypothetical protein